MASSTSGLCGSTPAPPPPTPSNQTISKSRSVDAEVALSRFLNQLELNQATPSLSSLPPRFSKKPPPPPPPPSSTPPVISFTDARHDLLLLAASDTGFFHLADHGISSDIFNRATNESQALFNSKPVCSVHSSLGLNRDDGDEDIRGKTKFLVFDTSSGELDRFPATSEYAKSLERVGLEVVELILSTAGFDNPFQKGTIKPKCLMWVSSSFDSTNVSVIKEEEEEEEEGGEMQQAKCYPYVVSLQYEMKACSIMGESGSWIAVDPCVGSVLVTLGDIAQVWSNGRFKKMRGTPRHASFASSDDCDDLQSLSMTLLVTLPVDASVSPLRSKLDADDGDVEEDDDECEVGRRRFRPFSFEEYAWRVYHERLPFNDPLIKYHI